MGICPIKYSKSQGLEAALSDPYYPSRNSEYAPEMGCKDYLQKLDMLFLVASCSLYMLLVMGDTSKKISIPILRVPDILEYQIGELEISIPGDHMMQLSIKCTAKLIF